MNEPMQRSHEIKTDNSDFQSRIDSITDRGLTPDTISTYASDALEDLVRTVDQIIALYDTNPTVVQQNGLEHERAALAYAGLDSDEIESTLDHIANTSEDIDRIASWADELTKGASDVITPPDSGYTGIVVGDGSSEIKKLIPRLKTILFILEKTFEIDINPERSDPQQFNFIPGITTSDMVRNTPYNVLDLPSLNRLIDVCDEEGNRTFVFDREMMIGLGITPNILKDLTKLELKELIDANQGIGRSVIYSDVFVETITSLLNEIPVDLQNVKTDKSAAKFLRKEVEIPAGHIVAKRIAENLDVAHRTVTIAIDEIRSSLSPVKMIISGNESTYYSELDQEAIRQYLDDKGVLVPRATPEQRSVKSMSEDFGVSRSVIYRAISALTEEGVLDQPDMVKFGSSINPGYSLDQQSLIEAWLAMNYKRRNRRVLSDSLESDKADEQARNLDGYESQSAFAHQLRVSRAFITKLHDLAEDELGEVVKRSGKWQYSPEQQIIIRRYLTQYLENQPEHSSDIPEGYLSRMQLAEKWDMHPKTFDKAVQAVMAGIGDILVAKRYNNLTKVYSPEQQATIYSWFEVNGYIVEDAPEGFLAVGGMSSKRKLGSEKLIERAIESLGDELGAPKRYKSFAQFTWFYSPVQQEQIKQWIIKNAPKSKLAKLALAA